MMEGVYSVLPDTGQEPVLAMTTPRGSCASTLNPNRPHIIDDALLSTPRPLMTDNSSQQGLVPPNVYSDVREQIESRNINQMIRTPIINNFSASF